MSSPKAQQTADNFRSKLQTLSLKKIHQTFRLNMLVYFSYVLYSLVAFICLLIAYFKDVSGFKLSFPMFLPVAPYLF